MAAPTIMAGSSPPSVHGATQAASSSMIPARCTPSPYQISPVRAKEINALTTNAGMLASVANADAHNAVRTPERKGVASLGAERDQDRGAASVP